MIAQCLLIKVLFQSGGVNISKIFSKTLTTFRGELWDVVCELTVNIYVSPWLCFGVFDILLHLPVLWLHLTLQPFPLSKCCTWYQRSHIKICQIIKTGELPFRFITSAMNPTSYAHGLHCFCSIYLRITVEASFLTLRNSQYFPRYQ